MTITTPPVTGDPELDKWALEVYNELQDLLYSTRIVLTSPNGTQYELGVSNTGTLTTTQIT